MVQKNEMIAGFEQQTFDSEMLKKSWKDQLINFKNFVDHGIIDQAIPDFINWILNNNNAEMLFAGSSLWDLLISKPTNDKLNYQQTLAIRFDNVSGLYDLEYSDWDTIDHREDFKKAILWKSKCSGHELPETFLKFMDWNKKWS